MPVRKNINNSRNVKEFSRMFEYDLLIPLKAKIRKKAEIKSLNGTKNNPRHTRSKRNNGIGTKWIFPIGLKMRGYTIVNIHDSKLINNRHPKTSEPKITPDILLKKQSINGKIIPLYEFG
jgi:hypothetical protein